MLLSRLRNNTFAPINGVRPLPPVFPAGMAALPPVDESFYQVRPLPPVVNPDAVRPLPPADGGVRLASHQMVDVTPDDTKVAKVPPVKLDEPQMNQMAADARMEPYSPQYMRGLRGAMRSGADRIRSLRKSITDNYVNPYREYPGLGFPNLGPVAEVEELEQRDFIERELQRRRS